MKNFFTSIMLFAFILGIAQPTTNAPVPTKLQANVVSVFSDTYTNIATNYNPFWGQSGFATLSSTFKPVPAVANNVLAYTNFNYQGTEVTTTNLSAMEFLHVDIWTSDATDVKVTPINNGTGPGEVLVSVPIISGSWSSVDIPKSAFTGMTWNSVFQMKFDGQGGVNPSNVYLDNIYFWKAPADPTTDATLSDLKVAGTTIAGFSSATTTYTYELVIGTTVAPTITAATTTNAGASRVITQATAVPGSATVAVTASNGTTMSTYTVNFVATKPNAAPSPTVYNAHLALLPNITDAPGFTNFWAQDYDFGVNQGPVNLSQTATVNNALKMDFSVAGWGAGTNATTNVNAYDYIHFDYFVPNAAAGVLGHEIRFILIGGGEFNYVISPSGGDSTMVLGSWQSMDVPLSVFVGKGFSKSNFQQFKLGSASDLNTKVAYFDNMYFYNSTSGVLGVNDVKNKEKNIVMYPNPVAAGENVYLNTEMASIIVYDMAGKLVAKYTGKTFSTEGLQSGVYIISATNKDGSSTSSKLIVK